MGDGQEHVAGFEAELTKDRDRRLRELARTSAKAVLKFSKCPVLVLPFIVIGAKDRPANARNENSTWNQRLAYPGAERASRLIR
jgi:hypothetical protein